MTGGRPSKRTPEREQRIVEALRAGNTRRAASAYGGISQQTFEEWARRYLDFRSAIEKAEGDAEVRMVAQIAQAAQGGTWTAAAWWLERRRPDDYGRRERIDLYEHERVRQEAERIAVRFNVPVEQVLQRAGIVLPSPN